MDYKIDEEMFQFNALEEPKSLSRLLAKAAERLPPEVQGSDDSPAKLKKFTLS